MKKRNETALVKACIDLMTAHGWTVWRQNQGAMVSEYKGKKRFFRFSGMKGISDIIRLVAEVALDASPPTCR